MLPNPESWRDMSAARRVVIWLGAFFVLAALWGGYFLTGPWQARKEDGMQTQRQKASLTVQRQQLWRREKALPRASVEKALWVVPFSALHFQSAEASLVSWKPSDKGGELVLETRWSPLPALFSLLAEREMTPAAFMIEPEGRLLRLTLQLEALREH